ncbi:MAG: PAS domain-containing sensor histidine kinase [Anaerolineae bacterium]|nr:PAS domain-containing sensor histidine kinase [Anaerolineae bacterium]MBL8104256.1 PAS domain-containing sensor histidine kinase [Anaerolineales bacterium]MCC7189933.1 PAS domain-containing sensor histidine kinase [Anaerolineales bacterium]
MSASLSQFENFDFRELPIGVYMTTLDGQIIVCNRTARKMLELPIEGPIDANIEDYYANPADRESTLEQSIERAKQGKNVERGILHLKVGQRDLYVEDYSQVMKAHDGQIIGFVGCMVDITSEIESRRHERELSDAVNELRFDIGRILHANTTTLVMVKQTLDAVIEAFEPKPFPDVSIPSTDEVESHLTDAANKLAFTIERLVESADEKQRLKALPASRWKQLLWFVRFLRSFKEQIPTPESYSPALRKVANEVGQIHAAITPGKIPRARTREIQIVAWELERLASLKEVLETRAAVIQMDYTIHSLREFITSDARAPVQRQIMSVKALIIECVRRHAEYARSLKVDIDRKEVDDIYVNVNEREIVRAFSNLMHNAIKYSWHRGFERRKTTLVSIRTMLKDQKVYIEFENWGVPIKREEIETGKVFELGYRGEMSKDLGRLGTGIGLTDANHIAKSHGGYLEIESHPAHSSYDERSEGYYNQPFLTKATFVLPSVRNSKPAEEARTV